MAYSTACLQPGATTMFSGSMSILCDAKCFETASHNSGEPWVLVYAVSPRSRAALAESTTLVGVAKSGWPTVKRITSGPGGDRKAANPVPTLSMLMLSSGSAKPPSDYSLVIPRF